MISNPFLTAIAVMPGLEPGIHAFSAGAGFFGTAWMAGSSPAMTGTMVNIIRSRSL